MRGIPAGFPAIRALMVLTALAALWAAAGCATSPPPVRQPAPPAPVPEAAREDAGASLDAASRRAARRLEELEMRRKARMTPPPPEESVLRQRYEEVLERPGTPEERKPEILLRLAELAYRAEESAMRAAYEAGEGDAVPPGDRYPEAIGYYRRLAEEYPNAPQALTAFYNLGYLYAEEGDGGESTWAYGQALERDAESPYADEIHMRLAEAAFDAGRVGEAIPHYAAVVRGGKPEYVDKALYKLGWCFFNEEDYGQAVESFARVLSRGEASPEDLRRETLGILAKALLEWGGLQPLEAYLADRPGAAVYGARLYALLGDLYAESSRYREAVAVYAAGVEAYPLAPECLDLERGIIASLLVVRDADAANKRRVSWAKRYGPNSAWERANGSGPLTTQRDALLEEGLRLAALHYHGRAQRGQGGLDRALALDLYRRYLDWFGQDTEAGYELAYAYAQALKEADLLGEAAAEYRRVAASERFSAHSEEASYRRIRVLETLYATDRRYLEELVVAHEEYVARNPESALVATVLFAEGELLLGAERFAPARGVFQRVIERAPGPPLEPRARERIARCWFREADFSRAEAAMRQALAAGLEAEAVSGATQLLSFSVFKQGEQAQEAGDLAEANRHFSRLADEFPDADVAQVSLYRVAENLRALGREEEAARVYDRLARTYRDSEYARNSLVLSAEIFASLGEWQGAAAGYEELYRADPDSPEAPDVLFRAARSMERADDGEGALRLFREFVERFPEDDRVAQALFRQGEILRARGQESDATQMYARAWDARATSDQAVYRASSSLTLGRMALAAFRAVPLRGDLAAALERKEAFLGEALEQLTRAASLPFAEPLTESLFLAGQAFEELKESLLSSERPADLTTEEQEEYQFQLEEKAFPLEERAISYYRKGVKTAREAGVHTQWVDRMFERLEALVPWAYQRPEEPALAWTAPPPPPLPGPAAFPTAAGGAP